MDPKPGEAKGDPLVRSWEDRAGVSEHLALELAHAAGYRPGSPTPLGPDDPVPGCGCAICVTLASGGTREAGEVAGDVARDLSRLPPSERLEAADRVREIWAEFGLELPSAGLLALLAGRVPGARRHGRGEPERPGLPVEEARKVPLLEVVSRLGLGQPVRKGRELVVRCPLHDDSDPSLTLNPERGLWYCFPCGVGGDGIRLAELTLREEFAEVVKWLAE